MKKRYLFEAILGMLIVGLVALKPDPSLRVFIFLETECPISQKTTQRIQALADAYAGRVTFEAVYPTETVTPQEVGAFERAYSLRIPRRLDPQHRLVKRYQATTTPEVILVSGSDKILYRGSVDDQFYQLGKYRPAPTQFYLKDAIEAALHNRAVAVPKTTAVGCLINNQ
ncbi:thioredoxin domain-containing protein [Tellurirhabdus bombi]|uniref:hypothetical protein n=1 Tax=Tellurirhabdus bombi TaxID=2907205 RepID=UPI001F2B3AA9|nr:hypothetical protein [Tellurirhabdus bombi]